MDGFVAHCLELLAVAGTSRARRMFGGWGLYLDDLFVAVIVGDRLYLKADDTTRAAFESAGCRQWVYDGKGGPAAMPYWSVPDEAMDAPGAMAPWARLALQAALAAAARPKRGRAAATNPKPAPGRRNGAVSKPVTKRR